MDNQPLSKGLSEQENPKCCSVCGEQLRSRLRPWLWHCSACGFWRSNLWNRAVWERKESALVEKHRELGIHGLRMKNAQRVLDILEGLSPLAGKRLLDIGCGYGWFLKSAVRRGVTALGVEPEERIAAAARASGQHVLSGCFPEALASEERFDIITFNDVLEHISDVAEALLACYRHLLPGGYLAINIPSSYGVLYRVAMALSSVGLHRPIDRMWQKDFHSPHVSYFNPPNLDRLVGSFGFESKAACRLDTILVDGLWSRIRMDATVSPIVAAGLFCGVLCCAPLIKLTWADVVLHVYQRPQ